MVVGGLRHPLAALPPEKKPGWASGPAWTSAENVAPTGIRSPDRPAHSVIQVMEKLNLILILN
jgi:hypothetical protein